RKILIETYNSGNGSTQVAEVEAIRTGGETTQTASVSREPKSIVAQLTEGRVAA
ncbi:MAG: hypothetical protein QG574_2609, partial [Cyanobacteriota bacterium erpe_2018_sw_21hr_WHONDRS-SW48-000092_B_bin.40]|nr:hypothetical protein [Cyanobacteriota bacterium erpe_2018_sw_21hr_WHONDRS-SW48-000092_B_bin.40]